MPCAEAQRYNDADRRTLVELARHSIAHALKHKGPPTLRLEDYADPLRAVRASFVTLTLGGQLRGCIGSLEAFRPLVQDVSANACAAAFRDPRFQPLNGEEFPKLDIHISILSAPAPIVFADEADLIRQLRAGADGLIVQLGTRRATFLPSVWSGFPDPRVFLRELKRKAEIRDGEDLKDLKAWRYATESFGEHEVR